MRPTPSSLPDPPPVVAFGAHPDDIEFGGGGVIARETRAGRAAHFVVCSRGLLFYALTRASEPDDLSPVLIDISAPEIVAAWVAAMEAHASQTSARNDVALQLTRARFHGLRAAVDYATALFPADPLVFESLSGLGRAARGF
jgi:LmbE family N-acetylglucosaminyl deacetylase